jgi:hypothetical protein
MKPLRDEISRRVVFAEREDTTTGCWVDFPTRDQQNTEFGED